MGLKCKEQNEYLNIDPFRKEKTTHFPMNGFTVYGQSPLQLNNSSWLRIAGFRNDRQLIYLNSFKSFIRL